MRNIISVLQFLSLKSLLHRLFRKWWWMALLILLLLFLRR